MRQEEKERLKNESSQVQTDNNDEAILQGVGEES